MQDLSVKYGFRFFVKHSELRLTPNPSNPQHLLQRKEANAACLLHALPIKTAFVAAAAINKNHSNTATPAPPPARGEQAKHCGSAGDE